MYKLGCYDENGEMECLSTAKTKEEAKELIFDITDTWYGYIMIEFKNKYHFTPQSVCRLEEI